MRILAFFLCASTSLTCYAIDAAPYRLPLNNAETIDTAKDHYSVSLLYGWVSTEDTILQRIFSKTKDGTLQLSVSNTFFDGDKIPSEQIVTLMDLKSNTDRPIAQTVSVADRVPADIDTHLTVKLTINRDDTIGLVMKAIESTKADLPADTLAAPWIGYSKAVSSITKELFGTNKSNFPIYWTGDVKVVAAVGAPGLIKEHILVVVSPREDGDAQFKALSAAKFSYSDAEQRVLYDQKPLSGWSHLVFRVSKAEPVNIAQLMFESNAPWAVVARSQFLFLSVSGVENGQQLKALSENVGTQLKSEIDLLNKEHRFSKYDRALTLRHFADVATTTIKAQCLRLKIDVMACPTSELQQFSENVAAYFGLQPTARINQEIKDQASILTGKVNSIASIYKKRQGDI